MEALRRPPCPEPESLKPLHARPLPLRWTARLLPTGAAALQSQPYPPRSFCLSDFGRYYAFGDGASAVLSRRVLVECQTITPVPGFAKPPDLSLSFFKQIHLVLKNDSAYLHLTQAFFQQPAKGDRTAVPDAAIPQ